MITDSSSNVWYRQALRDGTLAGRVLSRLAVLVLDEADLLLSYGHEADLQAIGPQVCQKDMWNETRLQQHMGAWRVINRCTDMAEHLVCAPRRQIFARHPLQERPCTGSDLSLALPHR